MADEDQESGSEPGRARVFGWDLAAAGLILCFLVLAALGVRGQDATYDERHYFGVGREILRTYEWVGRGALLHPPLSYYVNSLPLLWLGASSADDPAALFLCRMATLLVFGVTLLVVVFLWARGLYGPAAGILALALAAFSPTLLAHAPLITADVPLAATGTLALYLFHRSGHGEGRVWPWGLALGLALLTKISAWLFVLAVVIVGGVTAWRRRDRRRLGRVAAGLVLALLTVNLGYGFKGLLDWRGKAELIARAPDIPPARLSAAAAAPFLPLPYLKAAATQLSVARGGVPAYLLGEVSTKGWWHYFLVALAVKETVPFLLLLSMGLVSLWWWRPRLGELFLLLPGTLFFGAFSLGKVQIGIRYVLPAFPFLFIFVSRLARVSERWQWPGRAVLGVLLAAHAIAAVRACPDFIAYFNELVGGPENGYRYLADSNLDWGQNHTRLEARARERGILIEPDVLPPAGLVAVRANRLVGIGDRETYRLLREEYEPVGNVGYNWLIYDLGRNRRFPAEVMVSIVSGPEWLAGVPAHGWQEPGFEARGWTAAAARPSDGAFDPAREYPGTAAALLGCGGTVRECAFRRSFELRSPPARAILRLASREGYELWVNGRRVASRALCPPAYAKEEHRLESHLQRGPNTLALRMLSCGPGPPSGVFLEMRVPQAAPPTP